MASLRKLLGTGKFHKNAVVSVVELQNIVNQVLAEAGGSAPANMVTTDTNQTISGNKTFSGITTFTNFTEIDTSAGTFTAGDVSAVGNSTVLLVRDSDARIALEATNILLQNVTKFNVTTLPVFADEIAAAALATGDIYQTATGELRIKL